MSFILRSLPLSISCRRLQLSTEIGMYHRFDRFFNLIERKKEKPLGSYLILSLLYDWDGQSVGTTLFCTCTYTL